MFADMLACVIAEPDDDGVRMVYADALHARGDHQGELITTQLALAAAGIHTVDDLVARDDCRGAELARLADLLRHSEELVNAYGEAWIESVVGGRHDEFALFHRGFVEEIEFSVDSTPSETIEYALARTPLRSLHLDGRDCDDRALDDDYIGALAKLPCEHLCRLEFYGFDISSPAFAAWFERLPALTSVQFSKTRRDHFDVQTIAPLRSLRRLDLEVPITPAQLDLLGKLPLAQTLEHLSIGARMLLPNLLDVLDGRFPRLRSLVLGGNRAVDFSRLARHATVKMPARLVLRYCELSAASLEALVEHPAAVSLESLDLERNELHDDGAAVLARSRQLANLRTLNLDGTALGDAGARALGTCASARLTDLDISNNPISEAGLAAIVGGHVLRRLRYFDRTNPTNGAAVAAVIATLATLRSLAVGPLGPAGMQTLVESNTLAHLRELFVSDPEPALGRLQLPDLVVLRVFATVPSALRLAIMKCALPALVINE